MHSYLKAVGFSDVHDITQLNMLIGEIVRGCTEKLVFENEDGRLLAEISREFGEGFGLTVCGEYDKNGMFYAEYVFPYMKSDCISSQHPVEFEKHAANDSYCCACDDLRVGATIIFYLQNMGEYITRLHQGWERTRTRACSFTALAKEGTVLLPVEKAEADEAEKQAEIEHAELMKAAMDGDEEAIEQLSDEDYDTYTMLIDRVQREDVLSIVDTYFMPSGSDCECYSILGTIREVEYLTNTATAEEVIRMKVESNGILLSVGINKNDLTGEPVEGRRFRGSVWLQGEVIFEN